MHRVHLDASMILLGLAPHPYESVYHILAMECLEWASHGEHCYVYIEASNPLVD
jgi:hypothetical protein